MSSLASARRFPIEYYARFQFKVSVGQHSSNEWRNLRTSIYNAYTQNSSTIICVIKIKKPATTALSNSTKTISELTEMDDYYYNQLPNTLTEENEKWAQISSIKDEMIARAKSGIIAPHQYQVSKSLLIEFIEGQIDANNQIIDAQSNTSDSKEVKKENIQLTELDILLKSFEEKVNSVDEKNTTAIIELWNEYWDNIVKCEAPYSNVS